MTGSGTSDSPYIITTIQDLVDITDVPYDMSAYYQLGADIDLIATIWFIGSSYPTLIDKCSASVKSFSWVGRFQLSHVKGES